MKISKYAAIIKKSHYGVVIQTPDEAYLATDGSIYKAEGIPNMSGRDQIGAVLDIEPKKLKKIHIQEEHSKGKDDICGFNLEDEPAALEQDAEKLESVVAVDGNFYATLVCKGGEIQCPMLNDEMVMTYYLEGAPCYYSFTAPFVDEDGTVCCYEYDHDESVWTEDKMCIGEYEEGAVYKYEYH